MMSMEETRVPWWKTGVMYQIYPRSFQDSNGDGIGDLRGIIQRIDYLESLGIDIIWLGPIYESPNDDNGYDISDYYKIHPEFGTMEDFEELLEKLHQRGIKLIMDLVVNHTSDEHAWFESSRKSIDSPHRDYYYWRKGVDGGPPNNWKAFFGGYAWQFDETTEEYYLHLFTVKQPDLNWSNPEVRTAIYQMMQFWLDKGVDGFRMDVISLISKRDAFVDSPEDNLMHMVYHFYANGPHVHDYLQEMNQKVMSKYDVMTVGEGPGITTNEAHDYVGAGRKELNMLFQLDLMFLDNGPGGKFDYRDISLREFKKVFNEWDKAIGPDGWNNIFLDNHDFPRMVSRYGDDGEFREESAKMLILFLMTMRGTPCFYMGSEIGMTNVAFSDPADYRDIETVHYLAEVVKQNGDLPDALHRVHVQGRDNVRTPIQWDASDHGGFTKGTPWIKVNPNYPTINVDAAEKEDDSILHFYRSMIQYRKDHPIFVFGEYEDLYPDHEELYIYKRRYHGKSAIIGLNFSRSVYALPAEIGGVKEFSTYSRSSDNQLLPWEGAIWREKQQH